MPPVIPFALATNLFSAACGAVAVGLIRAMAAARRDDTLGRGSPRHRRRDELRVAKRNRDRSLCRVALRSRWRPSSSPMLCGRANDVTERRRWIVLCELSHGALGAAAR
jgi:hypothetical protein